MTTPYEILRALLELYDAAKRCKAEVRAAEDRMRGLRAQLEVDRAAARTIRPQLADAMARLAQHEPVDSTSSYLIQHVLDLARTSRIYTERVLGREMTFQALREELSAAKAALTRTEASFLDIYRSVASMHLSAADGAIISDLHNRFFRL